VRNAIPLWLLFFAIVLPLGILAAAVPDAAGLLKVVGIVIGFPMTIWATVLAALSAQRWKASLWQVLRRVNTVAIPALWGISWRASLALIPVALFGAAAYFIAKWLAVVVVFLCLISFAIIVGVAVVVYVVEDLFPLDALRRSSLLVRNQVGVAVVVGALLVPNNVIGIFSSVVGEREQALLGLVAILMMPFFFTAPVAIYLNARCHLESYHLETLRQDF